MRLRVETVVGVGALLALQLTTSFAAIGLLARTSPAAEQILREDVSLAAVEEMLGVLAIDGDAAMFDGALQTARDEASSEEESQLARRIGVRAPAALEGDPAARIDVVALARELSASNRERMEELDRQARFLGRAGAWASMLLGAAGFLLSVVVYRRLRRRLEEPVLALDALLVAFRQGELRQRANVHEGPLETRRIAENVNFLLDRHEEDLRRPVPTEVRTDRALLIAVIDRFGEPVVVLDGNGEQLAANAAALALLEDPDAPLRTLREAVRGSRPAEGWVVDEIPKANAWLCLRR
ncbi:MAG: hypothetical protein KC621_06190 [Myxococcales bacterium]|nr:hypothetical protein [Myxococcales bacterium]